MIHLDGGLRRGEGVQTVQVWLPDETVQAFTEFLVGNQRPADHTHRRRLSIVERALRKLLTCMSPAPCALLQRCAFTGKHPEIRGHMVHFPRNTRIFTPAFEFQYGTEENKIQGMFRESFQRNMPSSFPGYSRDRYQAGFRWKAPSAWCVAAIRWALETSAGA